LLLVDSKSDGANILLQQISGYKRGTLGRAKSLSLKFGSERKFLFFHLVLSSPSPGRKTPCRVLGFVMEAISSDRRRMHAGLEGEKT
jgi:hypothetical protein